MNYDILKKLFGIKFPYQAEHVGLEITKYVDPEYSQLRNLYYQILKEKELGSFLDHNLTYASNLLSSDVLGEEIDKICSLIRNCESLQELGLVVDLELFKTVEGEFRERLIVDPLFKKVVDEVHTDFKPTFLTPMI